MTQFLSILFVISSLSFYAWSGPAFDRQSPQGGPINKVVTLEGWVRSDGTHSKSNCSGVIFEDNASGKISDLDDAEKLEALHCSKEQDFLVKIEAEREARFLFWGGDLKVKNFEILEERASAPHIVESATPTARRTGRMDR